MAFVNQCCTPSFIEMLPQYAVSMLPLLLPVLRPLSGHSKRECCCRISINTVINERGVLIAWSFQDFLSFYDIMTCSCLHSWSLPKHLSYASGGSGDCPNSEGLYGTFFSFCITGFFFGQLLITIPQSSCFFTSPVRRGRQKRRMTGFDVAQAVHEFLRRAPITQF